MKLSPHAKEILLQHIGTPLVGLINKESSEIMLAPCITPKIFLVIDTTGRAVSGNFMKDNFEIIHNCNEEHLKHFNLLLNKNYVPRLANTPKNDEMSAHEFLFEQQCKATIKSMWGGFAVTLESSGKLKYSFASGAFNSPPGQKRIKGAELADIYKHEVRKQFNDYMLEIYPESETTQDTQEEKATEFNVSYNSNITRIHFISKKSLSTPKRPLSVDATFESKDENRKEKHVNRRLF